MSANDLMLDVSQAAELKMAFRRNDWTNADIKALSEGNFLSDVLKVMQGQAEIKMVTHLIDTDATPLIPDGMSIERHIGHGLWKWNLNNVLLFRSKKQKKSYQEGHQLRKIIEMLKGKIALNANVLDYLLAHQELIPESWKNKNVFFWGTIYRSSDSDFYVRCLYWDGSMWYWYYYSLGNYFFSNRPAVLAKA